MRGGFGSVERSARVPTEKERLDEQLLAQGDRKVYDHRHNAQRFEWAESGLLCSSTRCRCTHVPFSIVHRDGNGPCTRQRIRVSFSLGQRVARRTEPGIALPVHVAPHRPEDCALLAFSSMRFLAHISKSIEVSRTTHAASSWKGVPQAPTLVPFLSSRVLLA